MSEKNQDDKQTKATPASKSEAPAKGLDAAPKVETPKPPAHGSVKISLPVYLKLAGIRPDQSAGFEAFAHLWRIESNTLAAWHKLHDTFNKRPV